ncbi:hypothetical protein NYF14_09995 [Sphingobium sp. 10 DY56-G10]|uniref:BufA2 family periplasmic bufferin-type metallophore n=1 Tax=Sphingomonadales TaxID=204457 RepID=UPI0002D594C0|nr:hypothetical protein [Sphingomonas sp. SKA58]
MLMIDSRFGVATAAAAIAITAAAAPTVAFANDSTAAKGQTVHCYGVNSCKGTSDCKTASNECKGLNNCKGQGFKAMTAKACTKAGGSLTEPK